MCELSFQLKDGSKTNLEELRKYAQEGGNVLEKIKDAKMKVVWPHERPPPTGEVRAKLIHARMHKKQEERIRNMNDQRPGQMLSTLSSGFIILITVPCVAYSLYAILKWFGVNPEKAKIYSLLASIVFFLAELGLLIIQIWKIDKTKDLMLKRFNTPVSVPHVSKQKEE